MIMKKAQLMIEYMMVLVIMLLLFNSISLDLVNTAMNDTNGLQIAEMANSSKMVLSDAVTIVSLQGSGAKKTVSLRAPPDCDYVISATAMALQCNSEYPTYSEFNGQTVYSIPAGSQVAFSTGTISSGNLGTITVSKT